jgi:zinc transport system substrate-binding protein
MRKTCILICLPALMFSVFLSACSRSEQARGEKMLVTVSILPYADFVKKIGRDRVDVSVMIPPGASPATYEPTPRQMAELEHTRIYVKVGAPLPFEQAWLKKILSPRKDILVVDGSKGITIKENDPHIWLSPRLAKQQVRNICQGLIKVDPGHKSFYENNRDGFLSELDELDGWIRKELSGLEGRRFMIFHPSFAYFADEYGLEQVPIEIEGKDLSPRDLARFIEDAKEKNIRVIFASPQFSSKSAQVIAESIGGKVVFIDPLAGDYISNLKEVTKSLKQGMEGKWRKR